MNIENHNTHDGVMERVEHEWEGVEHEKRRAFARRSVLMGPKTWMAGTSPAMTTWRGQR
jgi:hypothetical protein